MVKEVSIFKMLLKNIDLLYIQQKTINKMHWKNLNVYSFQMSVSIYTEEYVLWFKINTNEFMAPGELIHANKTPGMLLRFAMHLQ